MEGRSQSARKLSCRLAEGNRELPQREAKPAGIRQEVRLLRSPARNHRSRRLPHRPDRAGEEIAAVHEVIKTMASSSVRMRPGTISDNYLGSCTFERGFLPSNLAGHKH